MIETMNSLAEKGFHICIIPQIDNNKWWWSAGIYVGMEKSAIWIRPKDADGPLGSFADYGDAFKAAVEFCNNYKPKVQHASKKATKR